LQLQLKKKEQDKWEKESRSFHQLYLLTQFKEFIKKKLRERKIKEETNRKKEPNQTKLDLIFYWLKKRNGKIITNIHKSKKKWKKEREREKTFNFYFN